MKKALVVLLAMVFAIGVSVTAHAAFVVSSKTNSEAIQKVGCEKAGSMSWTFDSGTTLTVGQWWYADLPVGVTLCQPLNFEIVDGAPSTPFGTQAVIDASIIKGTVVVIKDIAIDGAAQGITASVGAGVWFRVTGNVGSQRVLVTVMGAVGDQLSVDSGAEFTIKILDEQVNLGWMFLDTPIAPAVIGDGIYGNNLPADNLLPINNTYCINATQLAGNLVNVSYDSQSDFLTFTGDNEVAHVVAANPIALQACKGDTTWPVDLTTTQSTVCSFDYETGGGRYCPGFSGNDMIMKAQQALDEASYQVRLTITSPAQGVYWGAVAPTLLEAFTPAQNSCPGGTGTAIAPGWSLFKGDATTVVPSPNAGTCSVAAAEMGTIMVSNAFPITTVNNYNAIRVDMANLVFDSSVVSPGQIATVKIELIKVPCGVIFTGSRDIATFVNGCAAAVIPVPITMPYFPPITDQGWWSGAAFCNIGSANVDLNLTFYEKDGDVGTWDGSIVGHGIFNTLWSAVLAAIVPSAGNTGTLGDSVFFVVATPSVNTVKGFFMMGDGYQSMGTAVGPTCP